MVLLAQALDNPTTAAYNELGRAFFLHPTFFS
jgi:hypothetical protein